MNPGCKPKLSKKQLVKDTMTVLTDFCIVHGENEDRIEKEVTDIVYGDYPETQMKIKLFNREAISDGYYSNGMARYRRENNKELEVRVNEFMADKKVVDIKYQEATHGNYEDMDTHLTIMVMYEGVE